MSVCIEDEKTVPMHAGRNGGALKSGHVNTSANKGGRPKNAIREAMRAGLEDATPEIIKLAREAKRESDRIKAYDVLGKYGLGEQKVVVNQELFEHLAIVLANIPSMTPELADEILTKFGEAVGDN
jgi:hypothetical protein